MDILTKLESNGAAALAFANRAETIQELIDLYLPTVKREVTPATFEGKELILGRFAAAFGSMRVADLRPFQFQTWLTQQRETQPSEWTIQRVVGTVKRVFNWGVEFELCDKNPIARFRSKGGVRRNRRKPMPDEHFQIAMRFSPPFWRRFLILLKFSGARPGELAKMTWQDVRFENRVVILHDHKTAKATGRPRLIPLVPTTLKMLAWMRRRKQVSTIGLLEKLLAGGPRKGVEIVRFLGHYGISDRAAFIAREQMGVIRERVGGTGPGGFYQYRLPDDYVVREQIPEDEDFVFKTCRGYPLNKCNMSCWLRRVRKRSGVRVVSLYHLRHRYGFQGIKNKVNLKLLSLAMGHVDVRMTQTYIDDSGLTDDVLQAALEICYGPGAKAQLPPVPVREIPSIYPPPVEQQPSLVEQLPKPYAHPTPRPPVAKGLADVPLPTVGQLPGVGEQSVQAMLAFLMTKVSAKAPRVQKPTTSAVTLNPAHDQAYQAIAWAVQQNPALAMANDTEVYYWLTTEAVGCPFKLPPTMITWRRYVTAARHYYGTLKRILPCHKRIARERAERSE